MGGQPIPRHWNRGGAIVSHHWLATLLIFIGCEAGVFALALWKRRQRRGYHIVLHVRHRYSDAPQRPIVWWHPGPWEETLKHLPMSGTALGDKIVEAWEIR